MEEERFGGICIEQFCQVTDKVYERLLSEHSRVSAGQLEMAKWMIASLLLINGAALAACMQSTRLTVEVIAAGGIWFVVGIVLAILAGLGTWTHSGFVKNILRERIESQFIIDPELYPERDKKVESRVRLVSNISAAVGLGSLIAFTWGCFMVQYKMQVVNQISSDGKKGALIEIISTPNNGIDKPNSAWLDL